MTTLTTKIDGTEYKCILATGGSFFIRMIRIKADGTTEDAFLSNQQWKKEEAVKMRFAKEIKAHRDAHKSAA